MFTYELWDTDTFNLVAGFDTEAAALEAARELIELNRGSYPKNLALGRGRRDDSPTTWLASGAKLLKRIEQAEATGTKQYARTPVGESGRRGHAASG